ncbi:MAG TPA: amino acid permease [Pirellulales bacterium]|jgi:ethanolamine permease
MTQDTIHLKKSLGPVMLWGLGVGYVISGDYFGWNIGLAAGGSYGLLAAFGLVTVMAVSFVFSYTEMACAIPRAGGVFIYATRGLGPALGFLGGTAQVIEFVFAPPAIAMALGASVNVLTPSIDPRWVAVAAYVVFTSLNIWGVKQAAAFELFVAGLAVCGILLFGACALPSFRVENFTANALPHGWSGALAAMPFAVWLYLAIEGVANAAEEARRPQRDVAIGFGAAIGTLVVLGALVLFSSVGLGGWERVVYAPEDLTIGSAGKVEIRPGAKTLDTPLLLAAVQVDQKSHFGLQRILVVVGLLGFIASFNGIVLVAGRALLDMGRVGFLPRVLGKTHPRFHTPVNALLLNMAIGVTAIFCFDTGGLITMSALGAVTLYVIAMLSLFALRKREPDLPRPYRAPFYPVTPAVALVLALLAAGTMLYSNYDMAGAPNEFQRWLSVWYGLIIAAAWAWYWLFVRLRMTADDRAHFHRID